MFYPSTKEHVLLFFCLIPASNPHVLMSYPSQAIPMFFCSPVLSSQSLLFFCSPVFKNHVLMSNYHAHFSYSN